MEGFVNRLAKQRGVTKSEVIRGAIRQIADENGGTTLIRPYEAMSHFIGCSRGGPPDLSEQTGQKFQEILRDRRRQKP